MLLKHTFPKSSKPSNKILNLVTKILTFSVHIFFNSVISEKYTLDIQSLVFNIWMSDQSQHLLYFQLRKLVSLSDFFLFSWPGSFPISVLLYFHITTSPTINCRILLSIKHRKKKPVNWPKFYDNKGYTHKQTQMPNSSEGTLGNVKHRRKFLYRVSTFNSYKIFGKKSWITCVYKIWSETTEKDVRHRKWLLLVKIQILYVL